MIEDGIQAGDVAVVERDTPGRPGDRVIAVIDNECTLKILAIENGEPVLKPANPAYPVLRPGQDRLHIFGVVVGLIRDYRRSR
jgi:repressor LexA